MEPETTTEPEDPGSFADFGLSEEVAGAIEKLGWKVPTPIQRCTYDKIMAGGDMIGMAQTGTGKTAAFGIPMVEKLSPDQKSVQGLVLTPTRELALQVSREISAIGEKRGIRSAAVYGGASFTKQVNEVSDGAQIVAGTPGRVLDHIRRGTISFSDLRMLVLDEADEMLSMGFEKEISAIIESLPKDRQTLLFSATIPEDIKRLAQRYMGEADLVSVSGDAIAAADVSHFFYLVSGEGRPKDMVRVIEAERPASAIIFCNTRDETQVLTRHLKKEGYNADWLNSDLPQTDRERVMARTRSGELQFLVATDVAARGIDISHLSHVINYAFPESLEIYVHRTGRTGRMGNAGMAISLIAPRDIGNLYYLRLTYKIHPVEKALEDPTAAARREELGLLEALRRQPPSEVNGPYRTLARRLLTDLHAERIVAFLLQDHFDRRISREAEAISAPASEATEDREEPGEPSDKDPENEIYVDAGRKDGLRITSLIEEIAQRTSLDRRAFGKVRMLARSTFISVSEEQMKTVIEALQQIEVDGRRLHAEPAKGS